MADLRRENEDVRKALLESAAEAYTGSGVFSVRGIAAQAGINHGQIHHQFGGKGGLKRSMLDFLAQEQSRLTEEGIEEQGYTMGEAAFQALFTDRRFIRALARQLLETEEGHLMQREFPVVEQLVESFEHHDTVDDPTLFLAEKVSAALGWAMFGPWIRKALQLEEQDEAKLEQSITALPK